jgi:glycosyltransferase involved in cell wall biosynthesis
VTLPRVSVLLPVRNAASTLGECLASLAAQTLADHEVVAVDDHSTDGSRAILEEAARRDPRVRVVGNPGEGLVAGLNAAGKAARASLLARMDADDVCHPDRLLAQAACLRASPDLSVLGTCVRLVGTEGRSEGMHAYVRWLNRLLDHDAIVRDLFVESPLAHPSVMMRAEMLARLGGYRAFDGPEDYDLWLRAHAAGARFAKLPDVLLDWRDGPARLSRTDPRYAPARFRDLKIRALEAGALARRPAVVWGAGPVGKGWSRALRARGHHVAAFVEVHPRRLGARIHGVPVVPVEAAAATPGALHLAAVGQPGAREEIRRHAARLGLRDGADLIAVA